MSKPKNALPWEDEAVENFRGFTVLKSKIADYVHDSYDRGKFKLICDDLGLANLMVRSREDLTVIGVIDWEWSYIGPTQMLASSPWWLLMDRPTNENWDPRVETANQCRALYDRYLRHLDMFVEVLKEEEPKVLGPDCTEFLDLVEWSEDSGAMFVHMVLQAGFNNTRSYPMYMVMTQSGKQAWIEREAEVDDDLATAFGERKVREYEGYLQEKRKVENDEALLAEGRMLPQEFIEKHNGLLANITNARWKHASEQIAALGTPDARGHPVPAGDMALSTNVGR